MNDEIKGKYKGDKTRIDRRLKRERFVLPERSSFAYIQSQRNNTDLGGVINKGLHALEEENKKKLEGVFRNIDFNSESQLGQTKERNDRLKHLIDDFSDPRRDLLPS